MIKTKTHTFHGFLLFQSKLKHCFITKSNVISSIVPVSSISSSCIQTIPIEIVSNTYLYTYLHLWHIKLNIQLQSQRMLCMYTHFHVCYCFNFISKYLCTIKYNDYTTTLYFMLTNSFFSTKLTSVEFFYIK